MKKQQKLYPEKYLQAQPPKKETKNQTLCTEIRNVEKEVCYRVEHGFGVLEHQETQTERIVVVTKDAQTEESYQD